jgi:hypothetical protein
MAMVSEGDILGTIRVLVVLCITEGTLESNDETDQSPHLAISY